MQIFELVPWKIGNQRAPKGFSVYTSDEGSGLSAKKAIASIKGVDGELVTVKITRFASNAVYGGIFVPQGWWCGFVKGTATITSVIVANGEEPSTPHTGALNKKTLWLARPLPAVWLDSDEVLKMARKQGWATLKNLDMSAKMELSMSDPVEGRPSVPVWRTPFLTLQGGGDTDVIANVFVNAESGQVLVCPDGYVRVEPRTD